MNLRLAGVVAALGVGWALSACSPHPPAARPAIPDVRIEGTTIVFPKDSPQLATLKVTEANPERASYVRINGRITWDESRTSRVGSAMVGRVTDIVRAPGDRVRFLAVASLAEAAKAEPEQP